MKLGPVLPYSNLAIAEIEMKNPMEQAIEVYSLDFDKVFHSEEEILKRIENFSLPQPESIFLPLRQPGGEFWHTIRQADEKKRLIEDLKKQLKTVDDSLTELDKE